MRVQSRLNWILFGVTLSLLLPSLGSAVSRIYFPDAQFANLPFHSLIEASGGLMAIAIAGILIVEWPRKKRAHHYPWMAAALMGMGVLDIFHAAVRIADKNFVWLHSTATFVGGLLFALVWLGPKVRSQRAAPYPWLVLGSSIAFGAASCVWPQWIPDMLDQGRFTPLARGLNIGGGVGFLVAGAFFVRRFHRRFDLEDWLFAVHTVLFGAAGILFELSTLWDPAWWWWHVLRMAAYLAALTFAIRAYLDAEHELVVMNRQLNAINRNLDQTVEQRTAALSHERFLLQTLLQHLPDAIHFKDTEGRFTRVSRALASRFGLQPEELIGKSDADFFAPQFADEARADEQQLMQSGQPLVGKEENPQWQTDRESWVLTTKVPLPNEEGRIVGTFGISHDITDRKQAEQALLAAKQAAESANRAKSDFLANMSHEIRTPMNAIIGMTDLVLDTRLDSTQRDYLTMVSESAESLLSIINQILDFSKIEAGKLELESADFDVREEIGDTLKSLGLRAHAKHLELACHVHSDVPQWVCGDAVRLRQTLVNLVGNAIKFTERGEVMVDVHCEGASDDQIELHFTVRDTGPGIPPDKLQQVFSAFEQADSSTTRQFGGTGLGLAITSRIAEAMGGQVRVDSTPGQGSTFHLTVRFRPGWRHRPPELPRLDGAAALIVDDNETNRRVLREILQSWGMSVSSAASGPEAIDLLRQMAARARPLPLVISDVNMPHMDGFMLAQRLRSLEDLRETPIIMLTSGGRPGDAQRCQELRVCAQLMKPVKQSELLEAVMLAAGALPTASRVRVDQPQELGPPRRILLAEDGKTNQKMAEALLTAWGHTVTVADNGQQAIERWREQSFDVILMDVQMPVLDGMQATQRIRDLEMETGRRTPIVAMTARAMQGDRERCLEAGMDGYIPKPIRKEELSRALLDLDPPPPDELADDAPAVDWEAALRTVEGDQALMQTLVDTARQEMPDLRLQLEDAVRRRDIAAAQRVAHTIKGEAAALSAGDTQQAAAALEQSAAAGDLDSVSRQMPRLRRAIDQLVQYCADRRQSCGDSERT